MTRQVINIGTDPNDGTGDNLRLGADKINDNFEELYTLQSETLNAAGFPGATNISKIQSAINQAVATGAERVFVPATMLPYDATQIVFSTSVRMVREGGNWTDYDVLAYGAYGDGAHDDTTPLQAANSAAAVTGGVIYAPKGTYNFTTLLLAAGVTLRGAARGATIFQKTGSDLGDLVYALRLSGNSGVVEHCSVYGLGASGNNAIGIAITNGAKYCRISAVEVAYSWLGINAGGVNEEPTRRWDDCSYNLVEGCWIHDVGAVCITFTAPVAAYGNRAINCISTDVGDTSGSGNELRNQYYGAFIGCHAERCRSSFRFEEASRFCVIADCTSKDAVEDGYNVVARSSPTSAVGDVSYCVIANCVSVNDPVGFITNYETTHVATYITFTGCQAINSTTHGFHNQRGTDNTFIGCTASGSAGSGFLSEGGVRNLWRSCTATAIAGLTPAAGFRISDSSGISVDDNTFVGCNAVAGAAYGFRVDSAVGNRTRFHGCTATGHTAQAGIRIIGGGTTSCAITDCDFSGNTTPLTDGGTNTYIRGVRTVATGALRDVVVGTTGDFSSTVTATEFLGPTVDSGSAVDLVLQRNNVTQLTLASLAATFAGTATATEFLAPTIDSGSATDLVLQRNNVTQLTLASLAATFAGTCTATELLAPTVDSGSATDLVLQRNNVTKLTLGSSATTVADDLTVSGGDITITPSGNISNIGTGTADASDNAILKLFGGGAASNSRSAVMQLCGNESSSTGQLIMTSGNVTGAVVTIQNKGTTKLTLDDSVITPATLLTTVASASGLAGFRLPHGAAPSSPVDGDMWTTTAGLFVRINGVTKTVTLT